ncbi:MAG: indolepyruvate ferredoxin oxidoreductase subunit alpha [Methanosarcinales archaeon]|nr:indolepyruvate ferredoxin oxidoreductase subunit alpha [Methanosarcinales archaeon]
MRNGFPAAADQKSYQLGIRIDLPRINISDKYKKDGLFVREYLLGNVAIARGILEAGCGLASGYPGTPSSEIVESLAPWAGEQGMHVEWSVNEKVAMEVAIGGSWAGTRSVVTMKHVGLNVAADPFMTLAYLGVGGGLVIISADDPYCHSSQNEQDSRRYAQFADIPCLDPADPQEAKDMAIYAFGLSEKLNLPVMLRPTTRVSHARSDVETGTIQKPSQGAGFDKNPRRRVALPVHVRPLHRELLSKQEALAGELESAPWNSLTLRGDHGIIASGISGLYAGEAIARMDLNLSFLRVGTFPPPFELVKKMVEHCNVLMVVEELEPVLEEQVERIALRYNPGLKILGKSSGALPRDGEFDLLQVDNAVATMAGEQTRSAPILPREILPPRPPSLCPGCSHRATYYAMRKAFGRDAVYPSDIGCYTMAVGMGTVDTCLCMGASITVASGIRFGGEERPICCSLGDSTFLHSGLTGLLNAAYNKARITVAVLDNSTTAMTGHQPHPGTGVMATGEATSRVSLEEISRALGAGLVETVSPYDLDAAVQTFRRAREHPGLSVVIAEQACVIGARRSGERRRPFRVRDSCTGCKKCVEFGCPAIEFVDEKASINALCTGCGVCAQICPIGSVEVVE